MPLLTTPAVLPQQSQANPQAQSSSCQRLPGQVQKASLYCWLFICAADQQSFDCCFRKVASCSLQTNLIRCKRASKLFPTQKRAAGSPERAVALAHADTAQHSLLVGLALPQVLAHDVSTQAEAYDNQLGLRVGLLDVVNHRTKLPGATWKIRTMSRVIFQQFSTSHSSCVL